MPALAATPADRGECAASADKPDVGGAACSRIIDDASEQVAERVKAFTNRGRGSFNGKDYDRAIADYGEAIKLSPKDASAFAHRCEAYESKEDHVAAIADCTEAIKIDPKQPLAFNNRGVVQAEKGNFDAAIQDYAKAIEQLEPLVEQYPQYPALPYNLACAESLAGRTDDAIGHLRRALEADDSLRELARTDSDLDAIRDDPRFVELVGSS